MKHSQDTCLCTGLQTCLLCVSNGGLDEENSVEKSRIELSFCIKCSMGHFKKDDCEMARKFRFDGISIYEDFLSAEEESKLVKNIDESPWIGSQDGRFKQDYGPKVNFKKKKIKCGPFTGLPSYSKDVYERMKSLDSMKNFKPVELCNLDYNPSRNAEIKPHYDDTWIWGERLVTLNLLSDTILLFSNKDKYNIEVEVKMPRRSLLVVHGDARYKWKHAIQKEHITARRLAMTFRELSPEFMPGGEKQDLGAGLLETAMSFDGYSIGEIGPLE